MNFDKPSIAGDLVGIDIVLRSINDNHACLQFCVEDDGLWHRKSFRISSHWIDDLEKVVTLAKKYLESLEKDGKYGRKL